MLSLEVDPLMTAGLHRERVPGDQGGRGEGGGEGEREREGEGREGEGERDT